MMFRTLSRDCSSVPALVVAATVASLACAPRDATAQVKAPSAIVIRGARVIDGTGAPARESASIVIEGDRITAVADGAPALVPAGAQVIDGTGKTVIPGLIDAHVHYRDYVAELFLANGVTTVRDAGNPTEWILAVKRKTTAGEMRGPRLFVTGGIIDPPPALRGHHIAVGTPDEARATVRRLFEQGVDAVKVYTRMTPELLKPICDEAHASNRRVIGHVTMSARDAALAGIDALEHGSGIAVAIAADPARVTALEAHAGVFGWRFMDPAKADDLARLLVERHVAIAPALVSWGRGAPRSAEFQADAARVVADPGLSYVPDEGKQRVKGYVARGGTGEQRRDYEADWVAMTDFLARFRRAGGTLVVGTDGGALQGRSVHHELQLLVDIGLTPLDAIRAATKDAAELIQAKDLGTIAVGQLADLVVLDGNPLSSISDTKKISLVIQGGRIVDTRYHSDYAIPLPRPPVEGSRP